MVARQRRERSVSGSGEAAAEPRTWLKSICRVRATWRVPKAGAGDFPHLAPAALKSRGSSMAWYSTNPEHRRFLGLPPLPPDPPHYNMARVQEIVDDLIEARERLSSRSSSRGLAAH